MLSIFDLQNKGVGKMFDNGGPGGPKGRAVEQGTANSNRLSIKTRCTNLVCVSLPSVIVLSVGRSRSLKTTKYLYLLSKVCRQNVGSLRRVMNPELETGFFRTDFHDGKLREHS